MAVHTYVEWSKKYIKNIHILSQALYTTYIQIELYIPNHHCEWNSYRIIEKDATTAHAQLYNFRLSSARTDQNL